MNNQNPRAVVLFVILTVAVTSTVLAQGTAPWATDHVRTFQFRTFGLHDGLPQAWVSAIAEDKSGTVWVGTSDGVAAINGTLLETWRYNSDAKISITPGAVLSMESLGFDSVRVVTDLGRTVLRRWQGKGTCEQLGQQPRTFLIARRTRHGLDIPLTATDTLSITRLTHRRWGLHGESGTGIVQPPCLDDKGRTWIAVNGMGVVVMASTDTVLWTGTISLWGKTFDCSSVTSILYDGVGRIWLGSSRDGLLIVRDAQPQAIVQHDVSDPTSLPSNSVNCLAILSGKTVAVGTKQGLAFHCMASEVFHLIRPTSLFGAQAGTNMTRALYADTKSRLWIGTASTLLCVSETTREVYTVPPAAKAVRAIIENKDGTIMIGTEEWGLCALKNRSIVRLKSVTLDLPSRVLSFTRLGGDTILAAGRDALVVIVRGQPRATFSAPRRDDLAGLPNDVNSVQVLHDNRLLIGSRHGLFTSTARHGWDHIPPPKQVVVLPGSNSVGCIRPAASIRPGGWLVATWGAGVYVTDANAGDAMVVDGRYGLKSTLVYGAVAQGNLLLCYTNAGLEVVDVHRRRTMSFDESMGIQSTEFNAGALFVTESEEIVAGGIHGLTTVSGQWIRRVTDAMHVSELVLWMAVDGGLPRIVRGKEVSFPPGSSAVTLYIAPRGQSSGHQHLEYDVNDMQRWKPVHGGLIELHGMEPGEHRIAIRCMSGMHEWTYRTITISLQPRWYQRQWVHIVIVCLAAGVLTVGGVWFSRSTLKQKLAQEQVLASERARIAGDLHDDIGSALTELALMANSLSAQTHDDDVRNLSNEMLERIAHVSSGISSIVWSVTPGTLDYSSLQERISALASSMFRWSTVTLTIDVGSPDKAVYVAPRMARQIDLVVREALNNILKHAQATCVRVTIESDEASVVVSIDDDGIGYHGAHGGLGLQSMRDRLRLIGGALTITPRLPHGTVIQFRIVV